MQAICGHGTSTCRAAPGTRCTARFASRIWKQKGPMDRRPPYEAYAAIMTTFAGALAAAGALSRMLDRDPQCQTALDLTVLAVATFKAARTLARDDVSSFIREPFLRERADSPGRRA